jgi:hypothetical protein
MNNLLYFVLLFTLSLYAIFSPLFLYVNGQKEGMIECKLKPKECDKQFVIYQKEQEIKNLQESIKN